MALATRYELREFIGNGFSKPLGSKLRTKREASKLVKRLQARGRDVFAARLTIRF